MDLHSNGEHRCAPSSPKDAEAAAIFYTLFESAELAGIDPHRYVLEATLRAITASGIVTFPDHLADDEHAT